MTQVLIINVDIKGLNMEARQEAIRSEMRKALPSGWRVKSCGYNHTPDYSSVRCTMEIERIPERNFTSVS